MTNKTRYWLAGLGTAALTYGAYHFLGDDVSYQYHYRPENKEVRWEIENEETRGILSREALSNTGTMRYTMDIVTERSIHVICEYKSAISPLISSHLSSPFPLRIDRESLEGMYEWERVFSINPAFDFSNPESISIHPKKWSMEVLILPRDKEQFCRDSLDSLLKIR